MQEDARQPTLSPDLGWFSFWREAADNGQGAAFHLAHESGEGKAALVAQRCFRAGADELWVDHPVEFGLGGFRLGILRRFREFYDDQPFADAHLWGSQADPIG